MKLEIDEVAIGKAINASATAAMAAALGGHDMHRAVAQIVTEDVARGAIADAVKQAVAQVDRSALVTALAAELQRATTRAVVTMLNEGLVDIVCKLRGIGNYGEDVQRRAAVKAELLKAPN